MSQKALVLYRKTKVLQDPVMCGVFIIKDGNIDAAIEKVKIHRLSISEKFPELLAESVDVYFYTAETEIIE
jgi:hypothetical protein